MHHMPHSSCIAQCGGHRSHRKQYKSQPLGSAAIPMERYPRSLISFALYSSQDIPSLVLIDSVILCFNHAVFFLFVF